MTTQTRQSRSHAPELSGVNELLNHHLAISADLRAQVKQAHWTIVGPNFIAVHHLFDEVAVILTAQIDLFAERMRALQAIPRGTLEEAVQESDLPDLQIGEIPVEDGIRAILERCEMYSHSLTEAIEQCEQEEDLSTQDLFIQVQREIDQQCYLLRSHLPGEDLMSGRRDHPSRDSRRSDGHR